MDSTVATTWSVIRPEQGGQDRDKLWVAEASDAPRHEQWLWKPQRTTDDGSVAQTNDVSEVVASRIAGQLGLPAADCRYAALGDQPGVISKNVAPRGFELHDGATYLTSVEGYERGEEMFDSRGRQIGRIRLDRGYTLAAVQEVLEGVSGPPGLEELSAFQVFAGYLVLDALIANTDRHPKNWALLEDTSGARLLAPTFDHGSALGAGLTDEKRANVDIDRWCGRGVAKPFEDSKQTLVDLAMEAVSTSDSGTWIERVGSLDHDVIQHILEAPDGRMSVPTATFVEKVLTTNQRRLTSAYDH